MTIKRLSHAVYDTLYHLLLAQKYRKWILRDTLQNNVRELFEEILKARDCEIEEMEIAKDYVHLCTSIPPKYPVREIVGVLKSVSAKEIFMRHPEVKKELWGRKFRKMDILSEPLDTN